MDGFMDKIAQKLGAQEAIRANAAADAAQIERLEAQIVGRGSAADRYVLRRKYGYF